MPETVGEESRPTGDQLVYREQYQYNRFGSKFWKIWGLAGYVFNIAVASVGLLFGGIMLWEAFQLFNEGNPAALILGPIGMLPVVGSLLFAGYMFLHARFMLNGSETITVDQDGVTIESTGYFDRHIPAGSIVSVSHTDSIWPNGDERIKFSTTLAFLPMLINRRFYGFRQLADKQIKFWGAKGPSGVVIKTDHDEVRLDTDRADELISAIRSISAAN